MARRKTPVLRNLDDPLKVLNALTLRSCGLVLMFFGSSYALEMLFGLWSLICGGWAFLGQLAASAAVAVVLAAAERGNDEHLVPSALRYWAGRPSARIYGGGVPSPPRAAAWVR